MRKARKNHTPVEKVAILRRHLIDLIPVSDLCDEHQLSPMLFYLWQKQFFEGGTAAFERKNGPSESHTSARSQPSGKSSSAGMKSLPS